MAKKTTRSKRLPGLIRRGRIYHIDKVVPGFGPLRESTHQTCRETAERILIRRVAEIQDQVLLGIRPDFTFEQAAAHYLDTESHKASIKRDIYGLDRWIPRIGRRKLREIHQGILDPFIERDRASGLKSGTVRRDLAPVNRILQLAARLWRTEGGLSWLAEAPLIQMPDWKDARQPYPLNWDEQEQLLKHLPPHLIDPVIFAVNTGLRSREQAKLRWSWEVPVPELNTSVFLVPAELRRKSYKPLVLVLNSICRKLIDAQRGTHETHVWHYRGKPYSEMLTPAFERSRNKAGLEQITWHDLRHTFARRLRAAGVSHETRQDLLGHTNKSMTTHYSAAELQELIRAAERLVSSQELKSGVILRTS